MNKKIEIEKLKCVTTIVTHDNCSDGLASAILLHDVLPEAEIIFLMHGTEEYKNLQVRSNMLFVDIAPPVERAKEFQDAGALILDHHKTMKKIVEDFGVNGIFGDEKLDPGISGAPLAYRHVWKPLNALRREDQKEGKNYNQLEEDSLDAMEKFVARFAERAGIRDTWQRSNPEWHEAILQGEVLSFWPREFWLNIRLDDIGKQWDEKFHHVGNILMKKNSDKVNRCVNDSFFGKSKKGTRIVAFNNGRATSDASELLLKRADLIVGFFYKTENLSNGSQESKMIFSLRTGTNYNCAALAEYYGGGGHTAAAGFSKNLIESDENPFKMIVRIVDEYESKNS